MNNLPKGFRFRFSTCTYAETRVKVANKNKSRELIKNRPENAGCWT